MGPESKAVTFVELFFDLVFVFSVTQVVALLHHGLSWTNLGQAVLVFWLVWWAWTQYTWALNAADTSRAGTQIGVLVATAIAFMMAVAVPEAFGGRAAWFAGTYVTVRAIGLFLYRQAAAELPGLGSALRAFTLSSLGGLAAVLAGALIGGAAQYWLWGLAIVLDIFAAEVGGRLEGWQLKPDHFAERHGLFVIIALGETLIVAANSVAGEGWSGTLVRVAVLAVAATCGLWWTYFHTAAHRLEAGFASERGALRAGLGRDAYSLVHFVMLLGVILYAAAIEEAVIHPGEALEPAGALAFGAGILFFVIGMAAALRRAGARVHPARLFLGLTTAGVVATLRVEVWLSLALAVVGLVLIGYFERETATPHEQV